MKKGMVGLILALAFLVSSCGRPDYAKIMVTLAPYLETVKQNFFPSAVVEKVRAHTLAIATIYEMGEEEYKRRVLERNAGGPIWRLPELERLAQFIPLHSIVGQGKFAIAYIGAATLLKDNYAVSVAHLFSHEQGTTGFTIWVFKEGLDHPVKAELIARGDIKADQTKDYAVIKLTEDMKLPGLRIAATEPRESEPVIITGSVGGLAFFTRYGFLSKFRWFLRRDEFGVLHLAFWESFDYWMVYPGGPGDSGGSFKNIRGEIAGILYCGMEVYAEQYIFSNPVSMLWDFLKANKLETVVQ